MTFSETGGLKDHTRIAALIHVSGILGVTLPLIIWLFTRKNHPVIHSQGIESLNFHIQCAILEILTAVASLFLLGAVFSPVFYVYRGILSVWAAISVLRNPGFTYPGLFTRWIPNPLKDA